MMGHHTDNDFIESYIAYALAQEDSADARENFWAFDKFCDLVLNEPHKAWLSVLAVIERNANPRILQLLAAGPVEQLLVHHGEAVIDQVEAKASESTLVANLLGGVWPSTIDRAIWERIERVRSHAW